MRLLPLLLVLFISCNEYRETAVALEVNPTPIDSLTEAADSVNDALRDIKSDMAMAIDYAKKVANLKKEKERYEAPVMLDKYADALYYPSDEKDKKIRELTEKILAYEREIARLKSRIAYDSSLRNRVGKVNPESIEYDPPKPNEKSLIINLDKKMRGDGDISEAGVSVYLIAFKKHKEVKKLMNYEVSCETNYINSLEARRAYYYGGLYFFNDVPPGKYLIKVCAYYGNYKVIKRETDGYQMVAMQMSPPIQ